MIPGLVELILGPGQHRQQVLRPPAGAGVQRLPGVLVAESAGQGPGVTVLLHAEQSLVGHQLPCPAASAADFPASSRAPFAAPRCVSRASSSTSDRAAELEGEGREAGGRGHREPLSGRRARRWANLPRCTSAIMDQALISASIAEVGHDVLKLAQLAQGQRLLEQLGDLALPRVCASLRASRHLVGHLAAHRPSRRSPPAGRLRGVSASWMPR